MSEYTIRAGNPILLAFVYAVAALAVPVIVFLHWGKLERLLEVPFTMLLPFLIPTAILGVVSTLREDEDSPVLEGGFSKILYVVLVAFSTVLIWALCDFRVMMFHLFFSGPFYLGAVVTSGLVSIVARRFWSAAYSVWLWIWCGVVITYLSTVCGILLAGVLGFNMSLS